MAKLAGPHVVESCPVWIEQGGGFVANRLLITVNIPLDATDPNYDAQKASDLLDAVSVFARDHSTLYDGYDFVEGLLMPTGPKGQKAPRRRRRPAIPENN
jgi:hypothetical protein